MSTETVVWYSVDDSDHRYRMKHFGTLDPTSQTNLEGWAIDCAEHFHDCHDGWEAEWPLTITLYVTADGPSVGRCLVERSMAPVFTASFDD